MRRHIRVAFVTSAVLAAAALLPMMMIMGSSREETREIRIVARGMAFYVDGVAGPNPTVRLRAGERVRLVLVNEDAGMRHDLAVGSSGVATGLVEHGRQVAVAFRVPETRDAIPYFCTPHRSTMRGTIQIE
jgi:plastocyanin